MTEWEAAVKVCLWIVILTVVECCSINTITRVKEYLVLSLFTIVMSHVSIMMSSTVLVKTVLVEHGEVKEILPFLII